MNFFKKSRIIYTLMFFGIFLAEIIIALYIKDNFIRPYFGDVLVTLLLCCLIKAVIPKRLTALPVWIFLFATVVEIGQYFDFVKLIGLDDNRFFSILLGRSFSIIDILCYAIGCFMFFVIDYLLVNHRVNKN